MAVRPALRRLGMTTPWAPAHSAVRMTAPRLWGSDSSSQRTIRGASPCSSARWEDVLDRGVFPNGGHGDNPLMGVGTGHLVQLPPVGVDHHHTVGSGSVGDVTQGAVCISLGQINFINGGTGTQCLDDRVASFNDAIRFGRPAEAGVCGILSSFLQLTLSGSAGHPPAYGWIHIEIIIT